MLRNPEINIRLIIIINGIKNVGSFQSIIISLYSIIVSLIPSTKIEVIKTKGISPTIVVRRNLFFVISRIDIATLTKKKGKVALAIINK